MTQFRPNNLQKKLSLLFFLPYTTGVTVHEDEGVEGKGQKRYFPESRQTLSIQYLFLLRVCGQGRIHPFCSGGRGVV